MKSRPHFGWLLAGLLAAGCGGRMSPVTFAPDNMELAKQLSRDVGSKNMDGVRRIQRAAENRSADKMPNDEREAIKAVVQWCEKGEWDKAKKYIDDCIASGK